jgi:hypothetical protein
LPHFLPFGAIVAVGRLTAIMPTWGSFNAKAFVDTLGDEEA